MIQLLIVDDSALMRKLMANVFSAQADFEFRVARNGVEALEVLASYRPDVITLDINMPSMDGLTCLDRIMVEHPCPVVMVSSLTEAGAAATLEALHLGAVDFVAKPGGAISLGMQDIATALVEKVRAAAGAKLRRSLRLTERVRHHAGKSKPRPWRRATATAPESVSRRANDAVPGEAKHAVPGEANNAVPGEANNTVPGEAKHAVPGDAKDAVPGDAKDAVPGEGLVLIGTSTGGPPALEALLTALPGDFPWPIVVAQHMPASFTGPLARRLNGLCALTVAEVTGPAVLVPGHAYVGRGDADVIVSRRGRGLVAMSAPAADYPWHPSVDRLVRSAMNHLPASRLIGVLMTGMGSDGAAAMADLRMRGGKAIAESRETAVVWGMPGELVAVNGADWVVPLREIAECLAQLVPAPGALPRSGSVS